MMTYPCPFCGSKNLHVEEHLGTTVICCAGCLSVGPVTAAQSQAQAWQRWNTRHRSSPDDEECGEICRHPPHGLPNFELEDFV